MREALKVNGRRPNKLIISPPAARRFPFVAQSAGASAVSGAFVATAWPREGDVSAPVDRPHKACEKTPVFQGPCWRIMTAFLLLWLGAQAASVVAAFGFCVGLGRRMPPAREPAVAVLVAVNARDVQFDTCSDALCDHDHR